MQRVLFLGSPFFDYYLHIIEAFRAQGYDVDYYNDRPTENPLVKGAIKLRPKLVKGMVERYLATILEETRKGDYDLIFVVNGKVFTPEFISSLKQAHPRAESVLYLWDAITLYPNVLDFSGLFDRRYTFDVDDARDHSDFALVPLFYTSDYREVGESARDVDPDFDIVNVCSAHANRYTLMKKLIPDLQRSGLRVLSYLFLNRWQYAYNRLRSDPFKNSRRTEFEFKTLPVAAYVDLLRRSAAVLDVAHASQSGLTIRTIETVGARRKLITTNADVKNYSFYDPSRVLIIEESAPDIGAIMEFIDTPQVPLDPTIYRRYSIDSWVGQMINGEGHGA